MPKCPDPTADPDHCAVCEGWGHRCSAFREAQPERVAEVEAVYMSGWDPTRFYPSVEAAIAGERATAARRGRS